MMIENCVDKILQRNATAAITGKFSKCYKLTTHPTEMHVGLESLVKELQQELREKVRKGGNQGVGNSYGEKEGGKEEEKLVEEVLGKETEAENRSRRHFYKLL